MNVVRLGLLAPVALLAAAALPAAARNSNNQAQASGYQEVPTVSSPAFASFNARIENGGTAISYVLTYGGFTTPVLQAHIHLGRAGTNGGIMVFLCSNLGNGPAGTPECPTPEGTVSGMLTADGVVGPMNQGIAAGEFDKVLDAIRRQAAYVNIHTERYPGGEIRGQVNARRGEGHEDDD